MSYDIIIGNRITDPDDPEAEIVMDVELSDAPLFPYDPTGQTNCRSPGYSQWDKFCQEAGLYALFFDPIDGLMREHPGVVDLKPEHLEKVRRMKRWYAGLHRAAVPGWDWDRFDGGRDDGVRGRDGVLARLIWLEWWMGWALSNCARPALANR